MPVLFDQQNLGDSIRDLSLSKESCEVFASQLKYQNLLQHCTKITFYRAWDKEFVSFFDDRLNVIFCKDILGVLTKLGVTEYSPANITNVYGSIPIGHSTTLKEKYDAMKIVLQHFKHNDHQWVMCEDLIMVNFLLGQQNGYTK